jgi:hypothetical protein
MRWGISEDYDAFRSDPGVSWVWPKWQLRVGTRQVLRILRTESRASNVLQIIRNVLRWSIRVAEVTRDLRNTANSRSGKRVPGMSALCILFWSIQSSFSCFLQ